MSEVKLRNLFCKLKIHLFLVLRCKQKPQNFLPKLIILAIKNIVKSERVHEPHNQISLMPIRKLPFANNAVNEKDKGKLIMAFTEHINKFFNL